jgi:hypothetical protein
MQKSKQNYNKYYYEQHKQEKKEKRDFLKTVEKFMKENKDFKINEFVVKI